MTDAELPPCGLCDSAPIVLQARINTSKPEDVVDGCSNDDCPLHNLNWLPMTLEQWTALHTPAQVLSEVAEGLKAQLGVLERAAEAEVCASIRYEAKVESWGIKYALGLLNKAQQLSGRE